MENQNHLFTNKELRRGFLGLYFGRISMSIATGLLGVFVPIFLYTIFKKNVSLVMLYYGIAGTAYLFLVAFGAQFLNRFGFRKALVAGSFMAAMINLAYYFATQENAFALLGLSLISLVVFRILFWIPYHVDFATFN